MKVFKIPKYLRCLFIFAIILFILGMGLIGVSSKISEYPKYDAYSFSFYAFSEEGIPANFSKFRINYRFDEETGTFSFEPKEELHRMSIFMPKEYQIISVQNFEEYRIDFPYKLEYSENKKLMKVIFLNETKDKWILIDFKMKLSPNAKFDINKNSIWEGDSHFYFNMGNEYECIRHDCFFSLSGVEVDRSSLGTQQESSSSLMFIGQKIEGDKDPNKYEFEISARSKKAINNRTFLISFGASIIAGAIFTLFSIVIVFKQGKFKDN